MAVIFERVVVEENGQLVQVDDKDLPFWYTRTGQIVRTSIFFGLFLLFVLYVMVGYWHAKRRIRKGLKPLAYHRWLLNRQQRATYDPSYQDPSVYYHNYPPGGAFGMHAMPPPMYNPNAAMPPTYQPPEGATKVDPSQWRSQPTRRPADGRDQSPEYEAPSGPPPPTVQPHHTGASNNPFQ